MPRRRLVVPTGFLVALVVCIAARAEVDFRAPNKSALLGEIDPAGPSPVMRVDLARGTTLKVSTKGKRVKGGEVPAVTFDLRDSTGATVAAGTTKGAGARLKRHVVDTAGRYSLEFAASGPQAGLFLTKMKWKSPKGARETVSLTAEPTSVPFSAEAGSVAAFSVKPAKGSSAIPEILSVRRANGDVIETFENVAKKGKGVSAGPVTLPDTADYVLVVRSTNEPGDASVRVKLRAARVRSFKATTSDAVTGASDAGVVGTLHGAAVLPGGPAFSAPGGVSIEVPAAVGRRALAMYVATTASEFTVTDPDLEPIGPFVFCGPAESTFSSDVRVTIPAGLASFEGDHSEIVVYRRAADGTVSPVPTTSYAFDAQSNDVTFDADRFSTFAAFGPAASADPKLFSADIAASDFFGTSIVIDGDTAIVGALSKAPGGAAYAFVRTGDRWTQQQRLVAPDTALVDAYGESVDIDGDTAIVGSTRHDEVGGSAGSAYVWVRSGSVWTQEQELLPRDVDTSPNFGIGVAVSGDTVVVGAFKDDELAFDAGAAYVFTRAQGVWTLQQKLTASDGFERHSFGFSVDIDGDTVVVGAPGDPATGSQVKAGAYVFTRTNGSWTERAVLQGSTQAKFSGCGESVRIDAGTVVAGARLVDDVGTNAGVAWVFTGAGATWAQQVKLTPSDELDFGSFGRRVDLDGDRLVVGAWASSTGRAGAAYLYERANDVWTETAIYTPFDGYALQLFGSAVAVSTDAVLVGASSDDERATDAGAVYPFFIDP